MKNKDNIIYRICERYGYTEEQVNAMPCILLTFFANCVRLEAGQDEL